MEELTPDIIITLYTQLRDPTGQSVNEATDQLNQIIQIPQSIICFFGILGEADDPIIRSYATLNIRDYLLVHKDNISEDIIQNVRKFIVECLAKEVNSSVQLQIVYVISFLINYFPADWPDLNQFIYTEEYLHFLSPIIQIFIIIFSKLSDEDISSQMEYYTELILSGFQSEDFDCNYYALHFFYLIMIRVNDVSQFEGFQEPLFLLLESIIKKEDAQALFKFLVPISVGMNNNIIFLPIEKVFSLILPILSSDIEIDIKSPINSLLSLYLQIDTCTIATETLEEIFELEVNLAIQLYDLSIEDPTLTWLLECNSVFEGIYMRIPEETVVQMSFSQFQELAEQKEPQFILSAISVLIPAINLIPENFDSLIDNIFSELLNFLGSSDKYVQQFASESLSSIASNFSDFITNNIVEIVQAILFFIQEANATNGTSLLYCILANTAFSDPVFESLLPTVLEWLRCPDPIIKQDSTMILYYLIERGQQQVPYFIEDIASNVISLLKENLEAYYPVFNVIASLCRNTPELMINYASEFIPIIMEGIDSDDLAVKGQALNMISVLPPIVLKDPDYQEGFMEKFFDVCLEIANSELDDTLDDQILTISGIAVFQASFLVSYFKSAGLDNAVELLPSVLPAVVHIARLSSMNCLTYAVKSFNYLTILISSSQSGNDEVTNPTEELIDLFIEKLTESSRYEFSILSDIIKAIAEIIRCCGIDILKRKELDLIGILSSVLTQTMNPYTGALFVPADILDPISNLFIGIAFSTRGNTDEILEAIIPMLTDLLDHNSYQYQVFSIKTFAELISRSSTMSSMPDELKIELMQTMLKRITEAVPNVASAAASFIYQICKNEESRPLLEECVAPALAALMERLESVTNLTTENILMRENILVAIASIGLNILKNDFPVEETMETILKALPIVKQTQCNIEVYMFLNSKSSLVAKELQLEYIRIYSWVFAQPESQLNQLEIGLLVLCRMGSILNEFLSSYSPEQQKEIIEEALDNDEYKLACFAEGFESIKNNIQSLGMG